MDFVLQFYNSICDFSFGSGIHYACKNRDLAMVKLLLDLGADPNKKNRSGTTPISCVCCDSYNQGYYYLQGPRFAYESPQVVNDRIEIIKLLLPSYIKSLTTDDEMCETTKNTVVKQLSSYTENQVIKQLLLSY